MSDDDLYQLSNRPAARLLDELESIKGTLADGGVKSPMSTSMLGGLTADLDSHAKLLDIDQIFDENGEAAEPASAEPSIVFPRFTLDVASGLAQPAALPQRRVHSATDRETLIRELIDEFIPEIEAELHRRLCQLDNTALKRLKDPD